MVLALENSRVLRCCDPFVHPFYLFVAGRTTNDGIVQLRIPSLRILSLGSKNFIMRFEFDRVLSVRIC